MADQTNRGGKKAGPNDAQHREQHQTQTPAENRPAKGEPGGPKPNAGESRPEHHKSTARLIEAQATVVDRITKPRCPNGQETLDRRAS